MIQEISGRGAGVEAANEIAIRDAVALLHFTLNDCFVYSNASNVALSLKQ